MKYMKKNKPKAGDMFNCRKCNVPTVVTEVMIKQRRYWCKPCLRESQDKYKHKYLTTPVFNIKVNGTYLKDSQMAVIEAIKVGYDVIDGIISLNGMPCKTRTNRDGYEMISIRYNNRPFAVFVHRIVAYKKYKEQIFMDGIQVRHLDGIPNNNRSQNIAIGTTKDNSDDKKNYHRYRTRTRSFGQQISTQNTIPNESSCNT